MGKKPLYKPEEFSSKMDVFISYCESNGVDATDYQLIQFFDITPEMLDKYRTENILNNCSKNKNTCIANALRKLELYREDATLRQVINDSKLNSHCTFKLRQPRWGSWSDKTELPRDVEIRVTIGNGDKELME